MSQISRGFQGGMPPWSQGAGSCPAREGEAGSLDGIEATVKASFAGRYAKLVPLRVESVEESGFYQKVYSRLTNMPK